MLRCFEGNAAALISLFRRPETSGHPWHHEQNRPPHHFVQFAPPATDGSRFWQFPACRRLRRSFCEQIYRGMWSALSSLPTGWTRLPYPQVLVIAIDVCLCTFREMIHAGENIANPALVRMRPANPILSWHPESRKIVCTQQIVHTMLKDSEISRSTTRRT